jgi:hypothetical protein
MDEKDQMSPRLLPELRHERNQVLRGEDSRWRGKFNREQMAERVTTHIASQYRYDTSVPVAFSTSVPSGSAAMAQVRD